MTYRGRCEICDADGQPVSVRVVRWKVGDRSFEYESLPRCKDRIACRARVEAAGHEWLVEDAE